MRGAARSLVGRVTRWQVPGAPDGKSVVVHAAAPDRSALLARMESRRPSAQMPPLGTVVRDQLALDALAAWIASDLAPDPLSAVATSAWPLTGLSSSRFSSETKGISEDFHRNKTEIW